MPGPLYTVRIIRAKDIDLELEKIINFYTTNHDPRNADRDALTLLTTIKDRNVFTIEDSEGNIVAISAVFRKGRHLEKGGTRVIQNGYGFQKILNWCIACQTFLFV
ncbi:MAG: hypothetical protein DRR06_06285 [Gammaproteobacteria bacterium]|nr:MAG: hypothetical protein DRR06_06285 [Gammaproteobacteria bacterium]